MLNWPKISNHFQKLQTKIENLLQEDLDSSDSEIKNKKLDFSISTDEALIRGLSIGLPEDEDERALIVFSRLSSFFEIGVFCVSQNEATSTTSSTPSFSLFSSPPSNSPTKPPSIKSSPEKTGPAQTQLNQAAIVFLYGQFKAIPQKNELSLPAVGPSRVLCSHNDEIWKTLPIYQWIKNENLTSFLIQLDDRHSFIVFSRLAEPWLKLHFEKIHHEILKT